MKPSTSSSSLPTLGPVKPPQLTSRHDAKTLDGLEDLPVPDRQTVAELIDQHSGHPHDEPPTGTARGMSFVATGVRNALTPLRIARGALNPTGQAIGHLTTHLPGGDALPQYHDLVCV